MRCTKAIIYSDNLRNNINEIKKNLKQNVKLCCAVKANGYGNDAINSAKIAVEMGAEYLAIATVDEGIELREAGIKAELLLLSPCCTDEYPLLVENHITPLVFETEVIKNLNKVVSNLKHSKHPVFLAVDTGMGRIGCLCEEADSIAKEIASSTSLELAGMITHFAVSDSITSENIEYTKMQFEKFISACESVKKAGINPGIRTCAASAAAIAMPEYQLDMVRPGIILYGYYADEVTKEYLASKKISLNLKPVMQFETKVASIRNFTPGRSISYGRTWTCKKETLIGVLPVGYADGLLRRNSPGLKVTINGKAYPVVGRICMDQCMIDLGPDNKEVKCWDTAIIFGPKDSKSSNASLFDADDIAKMTNTISYEIMTSLSKRVKRIIQ